jgi:hypothetical protein
MPAPAVIVQLVELFHRNADLYAAPAFSAVAARHRLIDPFFAALGWDGPARRLPPWKGLVSNRPCLGWRGGEHGRVARSLCTVMSLVNVRRTCGRGAGLQVSVFCGRFRAIAL